MPPLGGDYDRIMLYVELLFDCGCEGEVKLQRLYGININEAI